MASEHHQLSTVQPTMTLTALMERFFNTEDACKAFLRDQRWPDGVVKCPRCGNDKVYELKARPWQNVGTVRKTATAFQF